MRRANTYEVEDKVVFVKTLPDDALTAWWGGLMAAEVALAHRQHKYCIVILSAGHIF